MRSHTWASTPSLMGAKPAAAQRSPEPVLETPSRPSLRQKYLRFSLFSPPFSTPPSEFSKPSAEPKSGNLFRPSFRQKDVLLFEWWLMKTKKGYNGRRLAVGGFTKKGEAVEIFNSAPIIKCHNGLTLETADGIVLRIQGPINKKRTSDNGFPSEVCTIFLFGFPTIWDTFTEGSSGDKLSHLPMMGPLPETTFDTSSQNKTVLLRNWWLRKIEMGSDGNRLAVSGFNEWGKAMRIFNSSPITKRHDVYTLETADGITIRIQGFINKLRTLENGFPLEACKTFFIGFPTTWTDFTNYSGDKTSHIEAPVNGSIDAEQYKDFLESFSFGFPVHSEKTTNLKNISSTSDTFIRDSVTRVREAIHEFLAQESNSVNLPLVDNGYHYLPEKGICDNNLQQVDASCGTNMKDAETVDKGCENHESDRVALNNSFTEGFHTEAAGCQTSNVDGSSQEKLVDDGKLEFIQLTTLKNRKKCSGHSLTKDHHYKGMGICSTGVSSDSGIGKNIDKEETKNPERVFPLAKPVQRSERLMPPKVGNVQGNFKGYSQCLNGTDNMDCVKLALDGSKTFATSQPNETLVDGISTSSNLYQEDQKFGKSSKPVRSERFGLPTLVNVNRESQDYSQLLNETNNANCANLAPDGSKPSGRNLPNDILVEGCRSASIFYGEKMKLAKSSAKPVRRSKRLTRLRNVHVESNDYSQFLDKTNNMKLNKISSTSLPNDTMLTGSPLSPTRSIPLPSSGVLSEKDQDGHPLVVASKSSTFSCDHIMRLVEDPPRYSKSFISPTLEKNMPKHCREKKDDQTVRHRMRVKQNASRDQQYFTTSKENISTSFGSRSRRMTKRVGVSTNMEKSKCNVSHSDGYRVVWTSSYTEVHRTPLTRSKGKTSTILTSDSLSVKRSRSGRLLIPTLDCSTRIIYGADGSIAGTANVDGSILRSSFQCKGIGTMSDSRKRKQRL